MSGVPSLERPVARCSGVAYAIKALSLLLEDRGQMLRSYYKAVRRAQSRASAEANRLSEEYNRIRITDPKLRERHAAALRRADHKALTASERLRELTAQPNIEDLLRVLLTSVLTDALLMPTWALRLAAAAGPRRAWWRSGAPDALSGAGEELSRLLRASAGADPSRAARLVAALRGVYCGACPVFLAGVLQNMAEIVGRIGGDAAAPRGGSVGGSAGLTGSWERLSDGRLDAIEPPAPGPGTRSAPQEGQLLRGVGRRAGPRGDWDEDEEARGRGPAVSALLSAAMVHPLRVVAIRCSLAGPHRLFSSTSPDGYTEILPENVFGRASPRALAFLTGSPFCSRLLREVPWVREGAAALRETLEGLDASAGERGLLRTVLGGTWACGLLAGLDVSLLRSLLPDRGRVFAGIGTALMLRALYFRADRGAKAPYGLLDRVGMDLTDIFATESGRARLADTLRVLGSTLPLNLLAMALGRAAVRTLFGGPSKKEWVRYAARRHFLRSFFYRHSEAFYAKRLQEAEAARHLSLSPPEDGPRAPPGTPRRLPSAPEALGSPPARTDLNSSGGPGAKMNLNSPGGPGAKITFNSPGGPGAKMNLNSAGGPGAKMNLNSAGGSLAAGAEPFRSLRLPKASSFVPSTPQTTPVAPRRSDLGPAPPSRGAIRAVKALARATESDVAAGPRPAADDEASDSSVNSAASSRTSSAGSGSSGRGGRGLADSREQVGLHISDEDLQALAHRAARAAGQA